MMKLTVKQTDYLNTKKCIGNFCKLTDVNCEDCMIDDALKGLEMEARRKKSHVLLLRRK